MTTTHDNTTVEAIREIAPENTDASVTLDLTDFGEPDRFSDVLAEHGLEWTATTTDGELWCGDDGLHMWPKADPITGEHISDLVSEHDSGYASEIRITGPARDVLAVYLSVVCRATYLKGELKPVTTGDGDVLASLSTDIGGVHWDINNSDGTIRHPRRFVWQQLTAP